MEDLSSQLTRPFPVYETKIFAIHMDGDIEIEKCYHHLAIDWREVSSISGTIVVGEDGDFSLVNTKSGEALVVAEKDKHLIAMWKDFVRNYRP